MLCLQFILLLENNQAQILAANQIDMENGHQRQLDSAPLTVLN